MFWQALTQTHKLTELSVVWDDVERPHPQRNNFTAARPAAFLNNIGISLGYYNDMDGNPVLMYGVDNSRVIHQSYTGEVVED